MGMITSSSLIVVGLLIDPRWYHPEREYRGVQLLSRVDPAPAPDKTAVVVVVVDIVTVIVYSKEMPLPPFQPFYTVNDQVQGQPAPKPVIPLDDDDANLGQGMV
jgi:hypothetical protein